MKNYLVSVSVIRVYHVNIKTFNEKAALQIAQDMPITSIERQGTLKIAETDYIECVR